MRHNFLYNANSIHGANLKKLIPLSMYVGYIYVVIRNCLPLFRNYIIRTPQDLKYSSLTSLRQGFKYKAALLLFMIYFALSTIMLLMILKSGGSINYFIEWSCVLGVLFGLFLGDTAMVAFASNDDPPKGNIGDVAPLSLIAAAVALQAAVLAFGPNSASLWPARDPSESRQLIEEIARAKRPVISDDMVALLRAGKPVLWEPAIQQLARDGVWSERPFIELIASHEFAFFVTDGDEGDELFEERYTPAIAEAIRQAYPAKRTLGGYTLHFE